MFPSNLDFHIFFLLLCGLLGGGVGNLTFFFLIQIYVPTNPRGAEMLPPGIVASESDFYLRRLWGEPTEVCKGKTAFLMQ